MINKSTLIEKYGPRALKRSALNIRNGDEVIKSFIDEINPKTIVEIGTYKGFTTAFMSQFCDKVITFDLVDGRVEQVNDNSIKRQALWDDLGIKNIHQHLVKNNKEKAEIINNLDFDFAFVDGGHQYHEVSLDFNLVKKCGNVLLHDYDFTEGPGQKNDVYDFINSLPKDTIIVRDIFALWKGENNE